MSGQSAFLPDVGELSSADGWISVHHYLPLDSRTSLLVVYQDIHDAGVTSASFERGTFPEPNQSGPGTRRSGLAFPGGMIHENS